MSELFLDLAEIKALTGHRRRDAQVRELRALGIDHKIRRDGSVVVLRDHVNKELGGNTEKRVVVEQPNWTAL